MKRSYMKASMDKTFATLMAFLISTALFGSCNRADMFDAASEIPIQSAVFIYEAGLHTGNMGGRLGADSLCRMNLQVNNFLSKDITRARALISTSEIDSIRNALPVDYWYLPVYGMNGGNGTTLLADNWNSLWDGSIDTTLAVAVGISTRWWNGSNSDGSYYPGGTCNDWTDESSATGINGDNAVTTWAWVYFGNSACNITYHLLCIAY